MLNNSYIRLSTFKHKRPSTANFVDVQYLLFIYTEYIKRFVKIEYPTKSGK